MNFKSDKLKTTTISNIFVVVFRTLKNGSNWIDSCSFTLVVHRDSGLDFPICKSVDKNLVVDRGREPGNIGARRSTEPGLERKRKASERMRPKPDHYIIDTPTLALLL